MLKFAKVCWCQGTSASLLVTRGFPLQVYELFLNFRKIRKLPTTGAGSVFRICDLKVPENPCGFPTFSYRTQGFPNPYFRPKTP